MELEIVRYEVIADYPGQLFQMGDIIETYESAMCYAIGDNETWSEKVSLKYYPTIFKLLKWWEHIEEKDAPEYVKLNPENTRGQKNIFKVTKAVSYPEGDFEIYIDDAEFPGAHAKYFLPATEQEYIDYHKSLK